MTYPGGTMIRRVVLVATPDGHVRRQTATGRVVGQAICWTVIVTPRAAHRPTVPDPQEVA